MGALELVGQIAVHIDGRNGMLFLLRFVLQDNRVGNVFYTDFLYIDFPVISKVLYVFHEGDTTDISNALKVSTFI